MAASLPTGLGRCHPKLEIWNICSLDAGPGMQATSRPSHTTSVYFSRATSWWWGMTFFFTPPSEIKFHAICWRWRSWVKNDGEEGRMMSFFDLGGHCMMLGSKKIIAASQWSFHKTKHMLIKPFFFFTFSPSFIKPHSLASQLSSSKEGWEMTGRHFPFVHMFCFVFHHQAEDR